MLFFSNHNVLNVGQKAVLLKILKGNVWINVEMVKDLAYQNFQVFIITTIVMMEIEIMVTGVTLNVKLKKIMFVLEETVIVRICVKK